MSILLISLLSIFSVTSQQEEIKLTEVSIRYQSTFASLPELYRILLIYKKVEEISPITSTSGDSFPTKTKRIPKKKWRKIMSFLESDEFQSLETSTEQGGDGAWYSLTFIYENDETKNIKI